MKSRQFMKYEYSNKKKPLNYLSLHKIIKIYPPGFFQLPKRWGKILRNIRGQE